MLLYKLNNKQIIIFKNIKNITCYSLLLYDLLFNNKSYNKNYENKYI